MGNWEDLKVLVRFVWLYRDIWEAWSDLIPLLTNLILCLGLTSVCPCGWHRRYCYWSRLVCLIFSEANAETPRSVAEKMFIHEAAKRADGRTSLWGTSLKMKSSGYLRNRVVWDVGKVITVKEKVNIFCADLSELLAFSWDIYSENGSISMIWGWIFRPYHSCKVGGLSQSVLTSRILNWTRADSWATVTIIIHIAKQLSMVGC